MSRLPRSGRMADAGAMILSCLVGLTAWVATAAVVATVLGRAAVVRDLQVPGAG